jgi:DNA-binding CsgD family transcriptional regulator
VLLCLFEGDSEKQVAARLGIGRDTVHEYVRRLHRHFEASSRGELLARCAPFLPALREQPEPRGVTSNPADGPRLG